MLSIRLCKATVDVITKSTASQQRFYSRSSTLCKKYKYQLDPKKSVARGNTLSQFRPRKKGVAIVHGKALTYFQFDGPDYDRDYSDVESPKQRAYAEIVESAIISFFSSKDAPEEIQDCLIEIVHVEVASSLTSAIVVWKLPDHSESKYTKEETGDILDKHLNVLRKLLPAYSTVTQTPTVQFVYDSFSEKQKEIDDIFERAKAEEIEFMAKNFPSEDEISTN